MDEKMRLEIMAMETDAKSMMEQADRDDDMVQYWYWRGKRTAALDILEFFS